MENEKKEKIQEFFRTAAQCFRERLDYNKLYAEPIPERMEEAKRLTGVFREAFPQADEVCFTVHPAFLCGAIRVQYSTRTIEDAEGEIPVNGRQLEALREALRCASSFSIIPSRFNVGIEITIPRLFRAEGPEEAGDMEL